MARTLVKNGNDVKGKMITLTQFVPGCCLDCKKFGIDAQEGFTMYAYCESNVWFPTKKGTCKKRKGR